MLALKLSIGKVFRNFVFIMPTLVIKLQRVVQHNLIGIKNLIQILIQPDSSIGLWKSYWNMKFRAPETIKIFLRNSDIISSQLVVTAQN